MTLTEFLLARIDEDEAVARQPVIAHSRVLLFGHDPARVLAECEAKRQLVENTWADLEVLNPGLDRDDMQADGFAPSVVRYLALPYADHEDYDESWRP